MYLLFSQCILTFCCSANGMLGTSGPSKIFRECITMSTCAKIFRLNWLIHFYLSLLPADFGHKAKRNTEKKGCFKESAVVNFEIWDQFKVIMSFRFGWKRGHFGNISNTAWMQFLSNQHITHGLNRTVSQALLPIWGTNSTEKAQRNMLFKNGWTWFWSMEKRPVPSILL